MTPSVHVCTIKCVLYTPLPQHIVNALNILVCGATCCTRKPTNAMYNCKCLEHFFAYYDKYLVFRLGFTRVTISIKKKNLIQYNNSAYVVVMLHACVCAIN